MSDEVAILGADGGIDLIQVSFLFWISHVEGTTEQYGIDFEIQSGWSKTKLMVKENRYGKTAEGKYSGGI